MVGHRSRQLHLYDALLPDVHLEKAKGKGQKAKVTDESQRLPSHQQGDTTIHFCLLVFAFCLLPFHKACLLPCGAAAGLAFCAAFCYIPFTCRIVFRLGNVFR
jgi:hypothetical protein